MPEYEPTKITRTEDIVVRSTTKNSDGYLIVTDEGGGEHKISPKRERLFPIFQPGAAVHLSYAEYKGKEYIANATPIEQMIKVVKPLETGGVGIPEMGKIIPKTEPAPQAVGMATKEIGDMIRAKGLRAIFGDEASAEIVKWYRGQILGITRVPFDGAKLPDFKKES